MLTALASSFAVFVSSSFYSPLSYIMVKLVSKHIHMWCGVKNKFISFILVNASN